MAFISGTATNHTDLYNKLRDFLVAGVAMPVAERWTQISGNAGVLVDANEIVLRGPGLAGADQILVGMKTFTSAGSDYFNLAFAGLTIFNPASSISSQINNSGWRVLHAWDDVIDYWIVANGRRFILVARVSTFYFSAYCGFALPFTLPAQYPYPLFVGATSDLTTTRWSFTDSRMRGFFNPSAGSKLLFPDVTWQVVSNSTYNGTVEGSYPELINVTPYAWDYTPLRDNLDGSYSLQPVTVVCSVPYQAQMARMDGVFRVSGFGNSAGSIVTFGGVNHLVVPDVYRNAWLNFAAIALE